MAARVHGGPIGHRFRPLPPEETGVAVRVAHQIDDCLLARSLADFVELRHFHHLIRCDRRVHPARHHQPVRVDRFEDLRSLQPGWKSVAAHIHQRHPVAAELLRQLLPTGHGAGGDDIGFDAVVVQNRAQQPQAVVLPLLVGAVGMDQVAQVAQVDPDNIAGSFVIPRPRKIHTNLPSGFRPE
jgi:hypothetical protein